MPNLPPQLLTFTLYHRAMRAGARRLVAALAADVPADRLAGIRAWYAHYQQACLLHAEGEDKVLWPALAGARPDLGAVFATMDDEHAELHQVLGDLGASLGDPAQLERSRELAGRLVGVLDRHLDHEERTAVPALAESLTDRLSELIAQVQQSAGPEGAPVAIPFFLELATDDERATVLGALPPPVREGYESSWRDAYARLTPAVPV